MYKFFQLKARPFPTVQGLMEALEITESSFWSARPKGQILAPDFTIGKSPRWFIARDASLLGHRIKQNNIPLKPCNVWTGLINKVDNGC